MGWAKGKFREGGTGWRQVPHAPKVCQAASSLSSQSEVEVFGVHSRKETPWDQERELSGRPQPHRPLPS